MEYDDYSFLSSVLSGDGWVPYNQLDDEKLVDEFSEPHRSNSYKL